MAQRGQRNLRAAACARLAECAWMGTIQKNGRTRLPAVKDSTEHDIKSASLARWKRIAESAALKNETARPSRKTRPLQIRTFLCTAEKKEEELLEKRKRTKMNACGKFLPTLIAAQPRRANRREPRSGTRTAPRRWLQRFVRRRHVIRSGG